jgi:cystathionine beta-lyase family protein involved in aluminum resistance
MTDEALERMAAGGPWDAPEVRAAIKAAEGLALQNLARVLDAFRAVRVAESDLHGSEGYGYGDAGRAKLETVYARLMGTEAALVRPQLVSGTHALAAMIRAVVRPGQHLVLGGPVYDTLVPLLDPESRHPLALGAMGVRITAVPADDRGLNERAWCRALDDKPDWVYLQRSRGYQRRPSWDASYLRQLIRDAHRAGALVLVDNCYGEFTDTSEPGHWGADLFAGSLLKNPGGGLAPTGGYVAGRARWVEQVADSFYAPGLGGAVGPTGPYLKAFWQGLFYGPHAVAEALCGAILAGAVLEDAGLPVDPKPGAWPRSDIVLTVTLPSREALLEAAQAVQEVSPVDSHVRPEPWAMPGYDDLVVMAAGGFVPGGSLELSADAPLAPPWRLYLQGGVMRQHALLAAWRIRRRLGL